jgi:hypothetical protein
MEQWRFKNGLAADLRVLIILGADAATFEPDDNTSIVDLTICKNITCFLQCRLIQDFQISPHISNFFHLGEWGTILPRYVRKLQPN